MRFLIPFLFALSVSAQPFSTSDPVFSQNCSSLLQGCVGAWRLEEASGTRYDLSGKNNNLTSNNSVGQAAGVSANTGNCATFVAASSQYLSLATNATILTGGKSFTIACWVKATTTPTDAAIATKSNYSGTIMEWVLSLSAATSKPVLQIKNNAGSFPQAVWGSVLSTNTWYFVLGQFSAASNVVAISVNNGAFVTASTTTGTLNTSATFNLGTYDDHTHYWNGSNDESGYWMRILTASEITQLYNSGLGTHFPFAHP